uniref:IGFALS_0 protein n=1 Tax=Fopius arisanus TaxID=64838 RepID=A0A0C9QY34_9HYME
MKIIIGINLTCVALLVLGADEFCEINEHGFKICEKSNVITHINNTKGLEFCTLHLENNTTISSNVFKNSNITELWLILPETSSPNLLSLHADAFVGLENLNTLRILDANISYTGNPWIQLKNLQNLRCISCGFTKIPTEILSSLPNLKELELAGNGIKTVHRNSFARLKNLTALTLERNGRMNLESGCFTGLDELLVLDLSHNSFDLLPGAFDGLKQLKVLFMYGITESNMTLPNTFRGMPALTRLELANGDLETLGPGMFDDLSDIRTLRVNRNKLHHIPKGVFNKLKSLKHLSLVDNNITTVETGAFDGLDLQTLDLTSNKALGVVATGTFSGLSVGFLSLDSCNITEIKPQAFKGLNAGALDLGHNQLTKIGVEDFSGLQTGMLYLSFNNISEIMPDAFKNTKVQVIRIDDEFVENLRRGDWGLPESVEIL